MARRKCAICGEWIEDNNDSVPYKNRYAHKKCMDVIVKNTLVKKESNSRKKKTKDKKEQSTVKQPKQPTVLKEGMSEEEFKQKKQFFDLLKTISLQILEAKDYVIAENYIKKYKFTWVGMSNTLKYVFYVLEKEDVNRTEPLRIIPQYYNDAFNFYESMKLVEQSNQETVKNQELIKVKQYITYKKKHPKINLIDIEKIGCEE